VNGKKRKVVSNGIPKKKKVTSTTTHPRLVGLITESKKAKKKRKMCPTLSGV
jgi:hypothetical protein